MYNREDENKRRRELAKKFIDNPNDMRSFSELSVLIRPIALHIMKRHSPIPSFEKDDYLQIADITVWRVLCRIKVKPEILDFFEAYVSVSIRNSYIAEFRKYVSKSLLEYKTSGVTRDSLSVVYLCSAEKYLEEIRLKRNAAARAFRKQNPEICRLRDRERRIRYKDKIKEYRRRYYYLHRSEILIKQKLYREKRKMKDGQP